jgi:hypothetical protein
MKKFMKNCEHYENDTQCEHICAVHLRDEFIENKKFWKELICLLSLHHLKMSFASKPAFAPTYP